MAKKFFLLFVFFLFFSACIFSATVGYVYGNQISSVDFEELPKAGTVFKDSENNILVVGQSLENVVVFDKLSTHSKTKVGDTLIDNGRLHTIFVRASLHTATLGYSFTTSFYPLRPVVLGGFTFGKSATFRSYVALGLETHVLFSNLWDSSFTLVEDGGLNGWCTFGAFVYPQVGFACSYGIAYRHYIRQFSWELGVSWLRGIINYKSTGTTSTIKYNTTFIGIGICL